MRRVARIVLVAAFGLFAVTGSASAIRPPAGARYLLPERERFGLPAREGTLHVSGDRRWLVADGLPYYSPVYDGISSSYVETLLSCPTGGEVFDAYFNLAPTPHGRIPINARGGFGALVQADSSGTPDKAWIRVRGQFLSGGRAIVSIVRGRFDPYKEKSCAISHRRFEYHLRPHPPFPSCRRAPGRTVAKTVNSRVYTNWGVDEIGRSRYAYACLVGGRQIVLGRALTDNTFGTLDAFKLAPPYVAYFENVHIEFMPDAESLAVVDLRGFGALHRTVAYPLPDPNAEAYAARFARFVLTPFGSLAWTTTYCHSAELCNGGAGDVFIDVWISDAAGTRRADTGQQIDPRSLRLDGPKVTWTNAGAAREAAID